jgi:hypothetical protein
MPLPPLRYADFLIESLPFGGAAGTAMTWNQRLDSCAWHPGHWLVAEFRQTFGHMDDITICFVPAWLCKL